MISKKPTAPPRKPAVSGLSIAKNINPGQLLNELQQKLGVTGVIEHLADDQFVLALKTRPDKVTDSQVTAVVAAHQPATDPILAQLQRWAKLSAADKDAVMLAVAKKVYGGR